MAPREISTNRRGLPRKESRSPSGRCVLRGANSRRYSPPNKKEGPKKIRATTWSTFWAEGSRQGGAFAESPFNFLRERGETQRLRRGSCPCRHSNWTALSVRCRWVSLL